MPFIFTPNSFKALLFTPVVLSVPLAVISTTSESCMDAADLLFKLGDVRLDRTAGELCSQAISKKTAVVKNLADDRAQEARFHRFVNNDKIDPEKLIEPIVFKTSDFCSQRKHVLLIQDTTDFRFEAANKGSRTDIGLVGHDRSIGFSAHTTLAQDAQNHECLGIADLQMMRKTEKSKLTPYERNCQRIEEKTSYRWLEAVQSVSALIDRSTMQTFVADRESDIYELYNICHELKCQYVIRSSVDRNTNVEKEPKITYRPTRQRIRQFYSLTELLNSQEILFEYEDLVPRISGSRKERIACFQVKALKTEILRTSRKGYSNDLPRTLPINCLEVKEINSSVSEPIYWRLITSHPIESIEDCKNIIGYYKARWNIEQLFRSTKKTGLKVEENQGKSYEALANIACIALISGCHTMQLVKARDPDSNCESPVELVFEKDSIPILDSLNKKYQGKTQKQMNMASHGSLTWAAWIIARMGGWKGYLSQGQPGPITMRRGLEKFAVFEQGWIAARMT